MARVLVITAVTGMQLGRQHTFEPRTSTVGSSTGADLVVYDRNLAPKHAEIRFTLDRYFIVPLAVGGGGISLNGKIVIGQQRLNAGDQLSIGATTYSIAFEEAQERAVNDTSASTSSIPRLGEYFLRRRLMDHEQVQRILTRQAELARSGASRPFGQIAYEMSYITRAELDRALAEQDGEVSTRFRD